MSGPGEPAPHLRAPALPAAGPQPRRGPGRGDSPLPRLRGCEASPRTLRPLGPEGRGAPSIAAPGPCPPFPGCHIAGCSAHVQEQWRWRGLRSGEGVEEGASAGGVGGAPGFPLPPLARRCACRPSPALTNFAEHSLVARSRATLSPPRPCLGPSAASRSRAPRCGAPLIRPPARCRAGFELGSGREVGCIGFFRAGRVRPAFTGDSKLLLGAPSLGPGKQAQDPYPKSSRPGIFWNSEFFRLMDLSVEFGTVMLDQTHLGRLG